MYSVIALTIGLVVGVVITFFVLRGQSQQLVERIKTAEEATKLAEKASQESRELLKSMEGERGQLKVRLEEYQEQLKGLNLTYDGLNSRYIEAREDLRGLTQQLEERELAFKQREEKLMKDEERLKETFENLSSKALGQSMEEFVKRSDELLKQYKEAAKGDTNEKKAEIEKLLAPMKETLGKLEENNQSMETKRAGAYGELIEQIKNLGEEQTGLRKETNRLVKALQDPGSAGQWGEMVLERVVELAGLEERVSFETQATMQTEDGRQRPDMKISLPGGRVLIVDSKAPMRQYLEGLETAEESSREVLFKEHAKKVSEHAKSLGARKYTDFAEAPDFTIMFMPSESAFRVALEARPAVLEEAMQNNVVIATPSTMLALLRAVAYGWRQEKLATEAREVQKMGQELYDRICTMMDHYNKAAQSMNKASASLNQMGRSLETRVLPSARRFKEAGIETSKELGERAVVESAVQELVSLDSVALPGTDS